MSTDVNSPQSINLLAPKHQGMRIDASGVLGRVMGRQKGGSRMLLKHLNELAHRYYAGDVAVVDEFLQLYCLDEDRPDELALPIAAPQPAAPAQVAGSEDRPVSRPQPSDDPCAQVAAQCAVVVEQARILIEVFGGLERMFSLGYCAEIADINGQRSAALMECLGDFLNGMDACPEDDDWTGPIFEKAQSMFPVAAPASPGAAVVPDGDDTLQAARYRWWRESFELIEEDGDGIAGCAFSCQIHPNIIEQKSSAELFDMVADYHIAQPAPSAGGAR